MRRPLLWSCVFFGLATGSLAFLLFESHIWSTTIVYSESAGEIDAWHMGYPATRPISITKLQIEYPERISETQSAQINVQVEQLVKAAKRSSDLADPLFYSDKGARELPQLQYPVHMSLESSDFDFGQDKDGKPGNDRFLDEGSPIPAKLTWAPTPRRSGETTLLLRLKNVRSASIVINGKYQSAGGNDDLPLHINVLTEFLISHSLRDLIAVGFATLGGSGGVGMLIVAILAYRRGSNETKPTNQAADA